jgi:hypothetical protein
MFFGKPRLVISPEDYEWQIETFRWLIAHFGLRETRLITPSRECFPDICRTAQEVVESTFARVLGYAGMEGWPCVLRAQEPDPNVHIAPTLLIKDAPSGPAGTFQIDEHRRAIITFNPALVGDVQSLVATFAHELAHYKLASAADQPPGGAPNHEFATDLTAVYFGFGVFLANTSFQFGQFVDQRTGTQGWRARRQGYLSQPELVHALALFVLLFNVDPEEPKGFLKKAWMGTYKKAIRHLKAQTIIEELRATPMIVDHRRLQQAK